VCDSLIGTLLNIERKTKDEVNAQLDLLNQYPRRFDTKGGW